MMDTTLIRKYNVPGPRYTSYPTVPYWNEQAFSRGEWEQSLIRSYRESYDDGISIYIHLPFCESLCTFCGCHKKITKRHEVEDPYIHTVLREWQLYKELLPYPPRIQEIHLGGGTPTFFSSTNLKRLMDGLMEGAEILPEASMSFEGHPNNTSREQLQSLYELGFRRVSYGVQDYDPEVQLVINRIQPFENVQRVHQWSREIGYTSVNHDLVFGLPKQNLARVEHTIHKTLELMPDRIAFYSYAHVPWIKGVGQRGFDENDLPKGNEKRKLYERGKELLYENGYVEIGMDHFALRSDPLYAAMQDGSLHRNFMGYTTGRTGVQIGLGMSAISDSWYGFAQNEKDLNAYERKVDAGEIPIFRGHALTREDLLLRKNILDIMCRFETTFCGKADTHEEIVERLEPMILDGLVQVDGRSVKVRPEGIPFVRNVCMAFDQRMKRQKKKGNVFSQTV